MTALIVVDGLGKSFGAGRRNRGHVAVEAVSFTVESGRSLGIVGESGSGKSTTLRCLMGLESPDTGTITYRGLDVVPPRSEGRRRFRREVQMVFQDPYASLDPRMTVEEIISEPLEILGLGATRAARTDRITALLTEVGIDPSRRASRPRTFSGGQRQRIAIARALAAEPVVLVCDEPVSALDVSVQAQIINLLNRMRRDLGLAMVFVAHDLAVVRYVSDDVLVMSEGRVVEHGPRDAVFESPQHEYPRSLLAAGAHAGPQNPVSPHPETAAPHPRVIPSPAHTPQGARP